MLRQVCCESCTDRTIRFMIGGKVTLSHTMAVLLCQRAGLGPLRFADLITS